MSEKNRDTKGRWRNRTIAFHVSPEEWDKIDEAVKLSGMTKQDYIISKLLDRSVVVQKSPRTYKALRDRMEDIYNELLRIKSGDSCSEELLDSITYVSSIYKQMKGDR